MPPPIQRDATTCTHSLTRRWGEGGWRSHLTWNKL